MVHPIQSMKEARYHLTSLLLLCQVWSLVCVTCFGGWPGCLCVTPGPRGDHGVTPQPPWPRLLTYTRPRLDTRQTLKLQATVEIWGGGVILDEISALLKLVFTFFRHKPLDTGWYWWLLFQSSSNWFRHAVQKRNACFDFNFIKEMSSFLSILILCQQHK